MPTDSSSEQEEQGLFTDHLLRVHTETRNTLNVPEAPTHGKCGLHTIGRLGRPPKRKCMSQNLPAR